jgi:SAM-dependent methyltransferase
MKEFWNQRYREKEFAYGIEPNEFLKEQVAQLPPGRILFPGEGEGRNAVYAAKLGWQADAFDWSEEAKNKAIKLAERFGVSIDYQVGDFEQIDLPTSAYDAVSLVFVHFPADKRRQLHRRLVQTLKPGGTLILEGFSKEHIRWNSQNERVGGPKDPAMLFSIEELQHDFEALEISVLEENEVELNEGLFHVGTAAVIRLIGKKK